VEASALAGRDVLSLNVDSYGRNIYLMFVGINDRSRFCCTPSPSVPKANPSAFLGHVVPQQLHLSRSLGRSRVRGVTPSRRIEDRIRNLSHKLIQAEEDTNTFETISAELRFAIFTLEWQIRTGLKNFPAELDRRSSK